MFGESTTSHSAVREWGPPALGIVAGICATALLLPGVRMAGLSWLALWIVATQCTIPVFVAAAVAVWATARKPSRLETALDVGCVATWFPPLVIFFRQQSPWAAAISAALAAAITRALLVRFRPAAFPSRFGCMGAALALQACAVVIGDGAWRVCTLALAATACLLTWILTASTVWPPSLKRRKIRIVPALLVGLSFSAGGLMSDGGHGDSDSPQTHAASREPNSTNSVVIGESYPGVLLWPDVEDHVTLVPPLPPRGKSLFQSARADSLSIPFFGAYWYFKGPGEPPLHPFVTHGDPAKLSFRSTDLGPLTMEARQNFGRHIAVSCCSGIGVAIRNADRHPGTVTMELALGDSALPGIFPQSLGETRVSSAPAQMLTFPMNAAARMGQFNEVIVRFHLLQPRSDRSARIAIRRFFFLR